jgi:hypothetical protein
MEYENRMEQHYAVSKSGVLVHIKKAHDSMEDCFCPHCGCRMLKRCGKNVPGILHMTIGMKARLIRSVPMNPISIPLQN